MAKRKTKCTSRGCGGDAFYGHSHCLECLEDRDAKRIFEDPRRLHPGIVPKLDIKQFIAIKVDGSDYGRGQIESVEASIKNLTDIVTNLIILLHDREIISTHEIRNIGGNY